MLNFYEIQGASHLDTSSLFPSVSNLDGNVLPRSLTDISVSFPLGVIKQLYVQLSRL